MSIDSELSELRREVASLRADHENPTNVLPRLEHLEREIAKVRKFSQDSDQNFRGSGGVLDRLEQLEEAVVRLRRAEPKPATVLTTLERLRRLWSKDPAGKYRELWNCWKGEHELWETNGEHLARCVLLDMRLWTEGVVTMYSKYELTLDALLTWAEGQEGL